MVKKDSPSWMFWMLAPFFILFVLVVTSYALIQGETISIAAVLVLDLLCILGFLGFFNPIRFKWAIRGAGLIIFLIYVAYLIYMLIESEGKFTASSRRSDTTVFNAILGLLVFGCPGIMVVITGKLPFFFKKNEEDIEDEFED